MAAKEIVQANTVMAAAKGANVKPPFVQRAGLWLAAGVGSLILLVTVGVLIFLCIYYPKAPVLEPLKQTPAETKIVLDSYKELSGIAVKNALELFQTIVSQALLPVFTAILGYIFAKGGNKEES